MPGKLKLSDLSETDFQPLINSNFAIVSKGSPPQSYQLIEVSALGAEHGQDRRHAFSLVFRGKFIQAPKQSMVELEHAQLGRMALFLVPIGPDQQGMRYQAVFT